VTKWFCTNTVVFSIFIQEVKLVSNVVRKATSHESVQMQNQVSRKALMYKLSIIHKIKRGNPRINDK